MKTNNFRMLGYAQVSIALINLVYQSGQPGTLSKSLFVLAVGTILLLLTFMKNAKAYFEKKQTLFFWSAISAISIITVII
ncbi:MAG: hypothetical protein FGM48_02130 [Candidatus Nanopelagicaceae bacterium]|nr:hypothetical protein [Candidatus Nanopelagicaceae bacterium]